MRNNAKEKKLRLLLGGINFSHQNRNFFSDPASVERQKLCESLEKIVLSCEDFTRDEVVPLQPPEPYLELEDGSYSCNFCGKAYKMLGSLNKHLEKNHAVSNAVSFECPSCQKKFETKFKLTRHSKACKK